MQHCVAQATYACQSGRSGGAGAGRNSTSVRVYVAKVPHVSGSLADMQLCVHAYISPQGIISARQPCIPTQRTTNTLPLPAPPQQARMHACLHGARLTSAGCWANACYSV